MDIPTHLFLGRKSIHKESNKETSNLQDDPTSIQETSLKFLRSRY